MYSAIADGILVSTAVLLLPNKAKRYARDGTDFAKAKAAFVTLLVTRADFIARSAADANGFASRLGFRMHK